jgi:hypothetical protein
MISAHKNFFIQRCLERGYEVKDAMACVSKMEGDIWTIDENHPAYPRVRPEHAATEGQAFRRPKPVAQKPPATPAIGHGPGTELKRLLAGFPFYIKTTPNCRCNARAKQMDVWGIEGCEERVELIVGWLKEEADRRKLPFIEAAGRLLVRRSIAAAKKKANV